MLVIHADKLDVGRGGAGWQSAVLGHVVFESQFRSRFLVQDASRELRPLDLSGQVPAIALPHRFRRAQGIVA